MEYLIHRSNEYLAGSGSNAGVGGGLLVEVLDSQQQVLQQEQRQERVGEEELGQP